MAVGKYIVREEVDEGEKEKVEEEREKLMIGEFVKLQDIFIQHSSHKRPAIFFNSVQKIIYTIYKNLISFKSGIS